ncbi:MAG: MFS transporter [Curtobacterium sp.]
MLSPTGPIVDRFGSTRTALAALGAEVVVLSCLPLATHTFGPLAIVFALWGVIAFCVVTPLQTRLVEESPDLAGVVLSWYSTAMYLGIALAPLLGAATLGALPRTSAEALPIVGAVLALAASVAAISATANADGHRPPGTMAVGVERASGCG